MSKLTPDPSRTDLQFFKWAAPLQNNECLICSPPARKILLAMGSVKQGSKRYWLGRSVLQNWVEVAECAYIGTRPKLAWDRLPYLSDSGLDRNWKHHLTSADELVFHLD